MTTSRSAAFSPSPLFLLQHKNMLKAMGKVVLKSLHLIQPHQAFTNWQDIPAIEQTIPAPEDALVDAYVAWCGAPANRYTHTLPPHMLSQWGLVLGTELALKTPYDLSKVINQGIDMTIHRDLPRQQPLRLYAKIDSIKEVDGAARLVIHLTTGTQLQPNLVEARIHMTFLLPGFKKNRKAKPFTETPAWQAQGTWQASQHDGLKFALLTGDFNPIHWILLAGKLSAFKGKVLHGFGMFVRSYELLPHPVKSIEVRFIKPVVLPSPVLQVETYRDDSGRQLFRLSSAGGNTVHLSGQYN